MVNESVLKFKLPDLREVEGYAVQLEDGTIVIRTKEELEKLPEEEKSGKRAKKKP